MVHGLTEFWGTFFVVFGLVVPICVWSLLVGTLCIHRSGFSGCVLQHARVSSFFVHLAIITCDQHHLRHASAEIYDVIVMVHHGILHQYRVRYRYLQYRSMSWGKSHDMVWVMRTCRWFRLARTYDSREGDMSW